MEREVEGWLRQWLDEKGKPLVLRGARQVGKTWAVRRLAEQTGRDLIELNFERTPQHQSLFHQNDAHRTLDLLEIHLGREVVPEKSLLFLDEIQAAPSLLGKLRWFAEDLPHLPVVAAGSLLEFALRDHSYSMPVGRISFRHVRPMTFPEYLSAHDQRRLLSLLSLHNVRDAMPTVVHEAASKWFHRFSMVGGMPAVVNLDVSHGLARQCRDAQRDLMAGYRADFPKYKGRIEQAALERVLARVAASVGKKFTYAEQELAGTTSKRALELLQAAGLCNVVKHSAANGLPLAAEEKDRSRKVLLLDVGLWHAIIGTPAARIFPDPENLSPEARSSISEQMLGQQLLAAGEQTGDGPTLHYWHREGGRPGEIDYVLSIQGKVVPIELKSGATGAMKSLHQFMFDKQLKIAVRVDNNPPSTQTIDLKTAQGNPVKYQLLSVPHYLAWNIGSLVAKELS
ncbi:MAG: AAA family ATPase [Deltaproteobacteria bacterium]|nr:AAA family ATPase [Deltaproteobacteria bacterium]